MTEGQVEDPRPRVALVLRGGGVKGLAFAGALEVLESYYNFTEFVGTSAGAVAAALLASGYDGKELLRLLSRTDFSRFLDRSIALTPFALIFRSGLYPGHYLRSWLQKQLFEKIERNEIRMHDLPRRAIIFASNAARGTLTFDSAGARDDAEVAFAVRCSMSIPFLFEPQSDGGSRVYDGGLLNNFPIDKLMEHDVKDFIALYLGTNRVMPQPRRFILWELFHIWLGRDEVVAVDKNRDRVVIIDPTPVKTADFRLSETEKRFLVVQGRAAAMAFVSARKLPGAPSDSEVHLALEEAKTLRQAAVDARRSRKFHRPALWWSTFLIVIVLAMTWHTVRKSSRFQAISTGATLTAPPDETKPAAPHDYQSLVGIRRREALFDVKKRFPDVQLEGGMYDHFSLPNSAIAYLTEDKLVYRVRVTIETPDEADEKRRIDPARLWYLGRSPDEVISTLENYACEPELMPEFILCNFGEAKGHVIFHMKSIDGKRFCYGVEVVWRGDAPVAVE